MYGSRIPTFQLLPFLGKPYVATLPPTEITAPVILPPCGIYFVYSLNRLVKCYSFACGAKIEFCTVGDINFFAVAENQFLVAAFFFADKISSSLGRRNSSVSKPQSSVSAPDKTADLSVGIGIHVANGAKLVVSLRSSPFLRAGPRDFPCICLALIIF